MAQRTPPQAPQAPPEAADDALAPDRTLEPVVLRRVPGGIPNLDSRAEEAAGRRTSPDQPVSIRLQGYLHPGADVTNYDHWPGVSWVVAFHGEHPAAQVQAFREALTAFIEGWVEQAVAAGGAEADRG